MANEMNASGKSKKLYTGSGDKGLTSLLPGSQVSKADERVAAIGGAEEIMASLGLVRAVTTCPLFRGKLERIIKTLRTLVGGLADPRSGKYVFSAEEIAFLETDMDNMLEKLPADVTKTHIPGGCEQSARLYVAHTTARQAERAVIAMDRRYSVPATFKQYVNRLCDYLLVAACYSDYLEEQADKKDPAPAAPFAVPPMAVPVPSAPSPASAMESVVAQVVAQLGGAKSMNLHKATRLVEAVEARAAAEGKAAVIAVANAEGNPVAVHVMDGAYLVSFEVAVKKAYTAVAVKMPTLDLHALCQPGQTFYGLQNLNSLVTFGGGVPLMVDGVLVGGLGVSGGTGEEDHALATYGASLFADL